VTTGLRMRYANVVHALLALAVLGASAACTSSDGISVSASRPSAPAERTEVITGSVANPDAVSLALRASGVFADAGSLRLPTGNPRTFTFRFARGNLVVLNATGPTSGPLHLNQATCAFSQSSNGTYRILSGSSTGSYAGTTGHGTYVFASRGIAPRTPGGTCDTTSHATPTSAHFSILLQGPLLLNEANWN